MRNSGKIDMMNNTFHRLHLYFEHVFSTLLGEDVNILSGGRYKTTEEQINSYSMRIYLTIDVR